MFKKGQTSSYDFIAALLIFMIFFVSLTTQWNETLYNMEQGHFQTKMTKRATQAIQTLVKSSGYPKNWSVSNVEIIGLAKGENILEQKKINEFSKIDYTVAKKLMILGNYDFYFEIDFNGTTNDFNFGIKPTKFQKQIVLGRKILINGEDGNAVLTVYK